MSPVPWTVPMGATSGGAGHVGAGGSASQSCAGDSVFRGVGVPVSKSEALSSVSTQPPLSLRMAVLLLVPGAGPEPSQQFALPQPAKSTVSSRSEEHTFELHSRVELRCRLLLEKKNP